MAESEFSPREHLEKLQQLVLQQLEIVRHQQTVITAHSETLEAMAKRLMELENAARSHRDAIAELQDASRQNTAIAVAVSELCQQAGLFTPEAAERRRLGVLARFDQLEARFAEGEQEG
jgi:hypothetical protein